jgi:hypothetical protein
VYHQLIESESSNNNLTAEDLATFAKLGISEGQLALAQIERVTDLEARERFGIQWDGDLAGIIFPYYLNGQRVTARVRRDNPEKDEQGAPKNKYVCAYGDRRHLYCPPDYEALLADPLVPLLYVESEKRRFGDHGVVQANRLHNLATWMWGLLGLAWTDWDQANGGRRP